MKTRKERAAYVARKLDELYPSIPIPLDHKDAYTLLIAVLLSAQCTDARVNMVTPGLFALADNPHDMAKLSVAEILETIKTCGLANSKAKNIRKLSEMLVSNYDGEVPRTFEQLEELPGVGHKTASVVMIHAFKIPAFPVDTHIHRLAQRWGLTKGKNVVQTEEDCKKLWPPEDWEKLHLQIITYGREYCTARGCDGTVCEICRTTYPNRKKPFIANKA
ncbi:endonuclease III [Pontiella agarivorans]|uniref:Endonuclease III n=1 Tax=Pontiella agarivorans TaxID=3038953 RepID=A0ABU5MXC4_9BACT|nr:endonuclease III [Pontiella agarivorans]MDZ8118848.1 endonuclease III [Pontiella agarivorans]